MGIFEYHEEPRYKVSLMFRRILVPLDGARHSFKALELALDLKERYGSHVVALYVVPEGTPEEEVNKLRKVTLDACKSKGMEEVEFKVVGLDPAESSVAYEVVREASEGLYDLVVMSSRGRTGSEGILLGSTSIAVAICVPCTVILVR